MRKFFAGWFISVLQALSSVALLATSAWLLSRADQRPSVMYLAVAVVGVRAFALGKAFFRYSERLLLHDATFRKASELRTNIFRKLVDRAPIGLSNTTVGSLITNLVDDTEEALNVDLRYRPALIQSIAVTLAGILVYLWLVPDYAWIMLLVLVAGSVATYLGSRINFGRNLGELSVLRSELSELSATLVNRARVIHAYGWQEHSISRLDSLSQQVGRAEKRLATSTGLLQSFIALSMYLTILAATLVSLSSGDQLPGEQVAVLVLVPLAVYEYLQALPNALQAKKKACVATQRLDALNAAEIPMELRSSGSITLNGFSKLEINDVSVAYPDGTQVELPNLELHSGESISLVAASGSGKSTLANLLVGFIRPHSGQVLINQRPITEFDTNSLREIFGLVEQQPNILAGNIHGNLLLAKPEASDEELTAVLREVGLWEMLSSREGLDTEVGISGARLSGGESQRLALARNLLASRELIVLDEPTSSVSFEQGSQLVQQFLDLAKKRNIAVILISHDPKLAKLSDRLVEF